MSEENTAAGHASGPAGREWVHIAEHAHIARIGRGWRTVAVVLIVVVGAALLLAAAALVRSVFVPSEGVLAVTVPRECRVSETPTGADVYVVVELAPLFSGSLSRAVEFGRDGVSVTSAVVLTSLPPLAELSDAEIERIVHDEGQHVTAGEEGADHAVLLLVGHASPSSDASRWDGVKVTWVLGEPVIEQTVPLGVEFSADRCAVSVPR
jgi:hypothetical protein